MDNIEFAVMPSSLLRSEGLIMTSVATFV